MPLTPDDQVTLDSCPVCGDEKSVSFCITFYEGIAVQHKRCQRCTLVYLNPRPIQSWYDKFFANQYWESKAQIWNVDVRDNIRQWRKQLHRAERYLAFLRAAELAPRAGTRVLEIGCAYGIIARTLADHYQGLACGIEPSNIARRFAQEEMGVEIIAESSLGLDGWRPEEPVDLVVFSHVLEYFADPNPVLAAIRRVISPNGLLLVETPNIHFLKSAHIFHPFCYSKRSLAALLERHGFAPAAVAPDGPVKSIFSSGFFTLAARADSNGNARHTQDQSGSSALTGALIGLGQAWFHLANRFPVNRVGGLLNGHRRPLSRDAERRLEALVAKADRHVC